MKDYFSTQNHVNIKKRFLLRNNKRSQLPLALLSREGVSDGRVASPALRKVGRLFDEGLARTGKTNGSREPVFITPTPCTFALACDTRWRAVGRAGRLGLTAPDWTELPVFLLRHYPELWRNIAAPRSHGYADVRLGPARLGPRFYYFIPVYGELLNAVPLSGRRAV